MSDRASDPLRAALHPAFVWDCDRCGRENFVRAARHEGEPPAEAPPDYEGDWLIAPASVECEACGADYATEDD